MIKEEKCIVMDIDGTLCPIKQAHQKYEELVPFPKMVAKLNEYKKAGFHIILYTARNMRTYSGNIGMIQAKTADFTMAWLKEYNIPYDEIHYGKPWQGKGGFYVDDKTIRPDEFLSLDYQEIKKLLSNE